MKLRDWIDIEKLDWNMLSKNPAAIDLLRANKKRINLWNLYANPAAMDIIEVLIRQNPYSDRINWKSLSANPAAINILKANIDNICWYHLSANPAALELLEARVLEESQKSSISSSEKINWFMLSTNPAAIELLRARVLEESQKSSISSSEKIDWTMLSTNPAAVELLRANPEKIVWTALSKNSAAINILKENPERIVWWRLSGNSEAMELLKCRDYFSPTQPINHLKWRFLSDNTNPAAIELLRANQKKIQWNIFSANPAIFTYDYAQIKLAKQEINREIIEEYYKPERFMKYLEAGGDIDSY